MADTFSVVFLLRVVHSLDKIPRPLRARIIHAAESLGTKPYPPGVKKLQGSEFHWIRVGDYRIVHEVQGAVLRILVAHRDAWRGMPRAVIARVAARA